MTITYDPHHPTYTDEADVRGELTRVFDVCGSCRRCVDRCGAFPTLFELLDAHAEPEAGNLTPAQQDRITDECHHCKLCAVDCPYVPERHEAAVDVPRMMLRNAAMRREHGHAVARPRTARLAGRADRVGRLATRVPSAANRFVGAANGSVSRRVLSRFSGLSAVRTLPRYTTRRFTAWFAERPKVTLRRPQSSVAVFPTCLVEYHRPEIGSDLVRVYERNGIECSPARVGCCGAPSLHAGDVDRFAKVAQANVSTLAEAVRAGADIVVPQPGCGYVVRRDYVDHVDDDRRDDAELVAAHTYDAAEYLMRLHRTDTAVLDTAFGDGAPDTIVYAVPPQLVALDIGLTSRDVLKLTGARVRVTRVRSALDGPWGLRSDHDAVAVPAAERLGDSVERAASGPGGPDSGDVIVAGDCHLANLAIEERTGRRPLHPIEVLARAYGLPED